MLYSSTRRLISDGMGLRSRLFRLDNRNAMDVRDLDPELFSLRRPKSP
jgi:hypothetical protein